MGPPSLRGSAGRQNEHAGKRTGETREDLSTPRPRRSFPPAPSRLGHRQGLDLRHAHGLEGRLGEAREYGRVDEAEFEHVQLRLAESAQLLAAKEGASGERESAWRFLRVTSAHARTPPPTPWWARRPEAAGMRRMNDGMASGVHPRGPSQKGTDAPPSCPSERCECGYDSFEGWALQALGHHETLLDTKWMEVTCDTATRGWR